MPVIKLSQLRQHRKVELMPITIPVGDDELHLLVRPDFYSYETEQTLKRLQVEVAEQERLKKAGRQSGQVGTTADTFVRLTIGFIAQWDLGDDDGKVYPLTREGVAGVPIDTLAWLWGEAMGRLVPGEATASS